jgi:hypothetical protein
MGDMATCTKYFVRELRVTDNCSDLDVYEEIILKLPLRCII